MGAGARPQRTSSGQGRQSRPARPPERADGDAAPRNVRSRRTNGASRPTPAACPRASRRRQPGSGHARFGSRPGSGRARFGFAPPRTRFGPRPRVTPRPPAPRRQPGSGHAAARGEPGSGHARPRPRTGANLVRVTPIRPIRPLSLGGRTAPRALPLSLARAPPTGAAGANLVRVTPPPAPPAPTWFGSRPRTGKLRPPATSAYG